MTVMGKKMRKIQSDVKLYDDMIVLLFLLMYEMLVMMEMSVL